MSKGKYSKNQGFNVRPLVLMLAVALLMGATIGGTIAWLTASTKDVVNTFTVGNINIELKEDDNNDQTDDVADDANVLRNFKMIPGNVLDKNPTVTVKVGSEASWVFVKVVEEGSATVGNTTKTFTDFIDYKVLTAQTITGVNGNYWIPLDATEYPGVYYCKVNALTNDGDADVVLPVIGYKPAGADVTVSGKVLVKDSVTKEMMDALSESGAKLPKLTFTAYAVQSDNIDNVKDAWIQATNTGN